LTSRYSNDSDRQHRSRRTNQSIAVGRHRRIVHRYCHLGHVSHPPKRHLDWFSRFRRVRRCPEQTDTNHETCSVGRNRPHLCYAFDAPTDSLKYYTLLYGTRNSFLWHIYCDFYRFCVACFSTHPADPSRVMRLRFFAPVRQR